MHPVKVQLQALLAQAKGTRWDVFASRVCGWGAILVAFSPYVHLLPAPEARLLAGLLGFIAQYLPRAQDAAGLWTDAAGQQTPFLKILPQLVQTLIAAPKITADAKAQADADADKQAQEALDQKVEQKVSELLSNPDRLNQTGQYNRGQAGGSAVLQTAAETPVGAQTPISSGQGAVSAGGTDAAIALVGGNQ